jgi:peroxiredoxin
VGEEAPGFTTTDVDGNELTLSDQRGKVVLLDFWGFW